MPDRRRLRRCAHPLCASTLTRVHTSPVLELCSVCVWLHSLFLAGNCALVDAHGETYSILRLVCIKE